MAEESTILLRHYFNGGGSALPAIRKLLEEGELEMAAVVARHALAQGAGSDRDELIAVLAQISSAPAGWTEALERFAAMPSEAGWNELMQFVDEDDFYQRLKYTVAVLIGLRCDGDILFRCVSRIGMIPELFDLARSGTVDPETIVARASGSAAEASWFGLAAQAALARGDRAATVRYLWRATQLDPLLSYASVLEVRHLGDAELNAELDRAGITSDSG